MNTETESLTLEQFNTETLTEESIRGIKMLILEQVSDSIPDPLFLI